PVSTVVPKICVTRPRQAKTVVTKTNSPPRRLINLSPSTKASNFPLNVTAVKALMVNAAQGVNTPRCDEDRLELMELMVFLLLSDEKVRVEVSAVDLQTSVAVKKVNDVTWLQALVDKKKVVITETSIRDTLRLDDVEGKGFSGVDTSLFKGMLVAQKVGEDANEVHAEDVNAAGVVAEGAASDDVNIVVEEPSIPSPTPHTPPPQPSQDIPSASQVQPTPPQSPQVQPQSPQHQPQPSQDAGISMDLLQNLMDTCITLTRRVEHLEQDKVAQALEITKLKSRVKKLERKNIASKLKRLKKDVVLEDAKDVAVEKSADVKDNADIQGRKAESQAEIYKIDLEHAKKVLSMQEEVSELAKLQEVVDVVTTAKIITEVVTAASDIIIAASTTITAADVPIPAATTAAAPTLTAAPSRRRKGVVIKDPQETAPTPSTIIHSEAKSKDKGKGILVEEPKPLKKQAQIKQDEKYARELEEELNKNIDWDEVIDHVQRKHKEDKAVKRYQALKRKIMMLYLKNVVGFKMDYFKGMIYDDIRPIFEKHFNFNVAFLLNTKEQMDEKDSRALKRLNESQEEKASKKQKMDEEVKELKRHL
nr:hypothetical protein [Tanacetum cinerariifolium]